MNINRILTIFSTLWTQNRLLWNLGLLHWALLVPSGIWFLVDSRTVSGINPWLKPIKFDISIAIYVWTMAWILQYLPPTFTKRISRAITASMLFESALIGMQAARGVRSHFNHETVFDESVYIGMAVGIMFNFVLLILTTVQFFRLKIALPLPALRGIQLGLVSLLVGNVMGIYMSLQPGSAVGMEDGGPGLPFLNWSTITGDLRVPHFIGLHGMQVLLVLGYVISGRGPLLSERMGAWIVDVASMLYMGLSLWMFMSALQGNPILVV